MSGHICVTCGRAVVKSNDSRRGWEHVEPSDHRIYAVMAADREHARDER